MPAGPLVKPASSAKLADRPKSRFGPQGLNPTAAQQGLMGKAKLELKAIADRLRVKASAETERLRTKAVEKARERPFAIVLGALVVGMLLGLILRSRGK